MRLPVLCLAVGGRIGHPEVDWIRNDTQQPVLRTVDALCHQKPRRAFNGSGVQVSAGGRNAGVSEGYLDQMDRSAALNSVGGVRVAEPVWRDVQIDSCLAGRLADDTATCEGSRCPPFWDRNTGSSGPAISRSRWRHSQHIGVSRIARVLLPFP